MSEDEIIRLKVRIAQLETALREIEELASDPWAGREVYAIRAIALASLPTPPSPPTEAHAMRELQVADDDTA